MGAKLSLPLMLNYNYNMPAKFRVSKVRHLDKRTANSKLIHCRTGNECSKNRHDV